MSPLKLALFTVVSALSFASVGCVVRTHPVIYETAYHEPVPAGEVVVVHSQPPVDQVEDPGPPPGDAYVWVRGRWVHTAHGWAWRSGHWVGSRAGHAWVPGRWVRRHHRWHWVEGHWQAV